MKYISLLLLLAAGSPTFAQTGQIYNKYFITGSLSLGKGHGGVNDSTAYAVPCSWLQLGNDNTNRGLLLPRVAHLTDIASPAKGLLIYSNDSASIMYYDGAVWQHAGVGEANLSNYYPIAQTDSNILAATSPVAATATNAQSTADSALQTANTAIDIAANAPNFATADLSFTGDRNHDAHGYSLDIDALSNYELHTQDNDNGYQTITGGNSNDGLQLTTINKKSGNKTAVTTSEDAVGLSTVDEDRHKSITLPRKTEDHITITDEHNYPAEYADDYSNNYDDRSIPDVAFVYNQIGAATEGVLTSESDPYFSSSAAAGIGTGNISNWNTAYTQSAANATALAGKEPAITPGTTAQYWRGDKTWQPFNSNARSAISLTTTGSSGAATYSTSTGIINVPTYTASGLGAEPAVTTGTTAQYWNGAKAWTDFNNSAHSAFSLTTTGTSGTPTYNTATGAWNIPAYTLSGLGGWSTSGNTNASEAILGNVSGGGNINIKQAGATAMYIKQNTTSGAPNVGITTTTPQYPLDIFVPANGGYTGLNISSTDDANARPGIRQQATRVGASGISYNMFEQYLGLAGYPLVRGATIGISGQASTTSSAAYMYLGSETSTDYQTNTFRLYPTQYASFVSAVAIGTHKTTPLAALDVTGGGVFTLPVKLPHLIGSSAAPTTAAGTGAGATPTIALSGTDMAGKLTITTATGSTPTAGGTLVTVTFSSAYTTAPSILFTPANDNAAGILIVAGSSTTTFTVTIKSGTSLAPNTTYGWYYQVVQ